MLALPSAAPANNIASATLPTMGVASVTIPADGHQVYRVPLSANDWVIGYAWTPGTRHAAATIRVLEPGASDITSDAVTASTASGVVFYRAPVAGTYWIDFSAEAGTSVERGLFVSRPTLAPTSRSVVVVPYGGTFTASCVLRDQLYNYMPYDGPALAFEGVVLNVSRNGATPTPAWRGSTNLVGKASRPIKGITRRLQFSFHYPGAIYDSAAFGSASTGVVTVIPRVRLVVRTPKGVRRNRAFRVSGTLQPSAPAGRSNIVAEMRKRGSRRIFTFAMSTRAPKRGASAVWGTAVLPSGGTWYVRMRRPAESGYAATTTKWVTFRVR